MPYSESPQVAAGTTIPPATRSIADRLRSPLAVAQVDSNRWLIAILVALASVLPAVGLNRFYLLTLTYGYLFAGIAISWFLLARAGQISLGHAAFFGLGAYASALVTLRLELSPWLGLACGLIAAVLFALPMGIVCFRFHGLYFALATFAAAEVAKALVLNWDSVTYGAQGLVGIPGFPAFNLGGLRVDFDVSRLPNYYVALIFLAISLLVAHQVISGSLGLAFTAVRESEEAAEAIGVDTARVKMIALLISAAITGAGGALYAHLLHYLEPSLAFSVSVSSLPLVMSLFGGLVSLAGPLIGGMILYLVDELVFQSYFPAWHQMLYGATLIFVVLYMPRGFIGWLYERLQGTRGWFMAASQRGKLEPRKLQHRPVPVERPAMHTGAAHKARPAALDDGAPLLEIRDLTRRFDGLVAVDSVNIHIDEQEIVGLLGPNGSGKTTLINMIAGRVAPTAGTVYFAGRDITHLPAHARCHLGLARTFQTVKPFDHLTVLDNVAVGAVYGGRPRMPLPEARKVAARLLEAVDLTEKASDLAGTLSMGQRKRLELARALATRPRLLLLDEIGAGLTPAGGVALRQLLAGLRDQGLTILGVEHALYALTDIADRLVVMEKGRVIVEGPPDAVLGDPRVVDAYMGE